jgi:hypothetical protein
MKLALKLVDGQNPVGAKHYRNNLSVIAKSCRGKALPQQFTNFAII